MSYLTAGLLSGAGKGMQTIAGEMWAEQRAQADQLRKKDLMDYQNNINLTNRDAQWTREDTIRKNQWDREDTLTKAEHDRQDTLTKAEHTRTDTENKNTRQDWQVSPNDPTKMIAYNKYGKPIPGTERPMNATELAAKKKAEAGGTVAKFDAPLYKEANKLLVDEYKTRAITMLKESKDPKDTLDSFMAQGTMGVSELDLNKVGSRFPGLKQEIDVERFLMGERLKAGETNPQTALNDAINEYKAATAAGRKALDDKRIKAISDQTGVPAKEVKAYETFDMSPENIKKRAAMYDVNNKDDRRELENLGKVNPAAKTALIDEIDKLKAAASPPAPDQVPPAPDQPAPADNGTAGASQEEPWYRNMLGEKGKQYLNESNKADIASGAAVYLNALSGKSKAEQQSMLAQWRKSGKLLPQVDEYIQQTLNTQTIASNGML